MSETKNYTMYNIKTTTADGKEDVKLYVAEKKLDEIKEEAVKVGTDVQVLRVQTFSLTQASSVDEILTITPNAEVALAYYNYGLSLAQHNVKKELMEDPDWQPQDGVYDLLADVQQPKEKRVSDPASAMRRTMRAYWAKLHPGAPEPTDEDINNVLASFEAALKPTAA